EDLWSIDRMNRSSTKKSMGFVVTRGLLVGPAHIIHPFSLFRMPYWILLLPLCLVLAMAVFRLARLIIRIRRGHCRRCGYDLRESRGSPCPECGAGNPSSLPKPQPHQSVQSSV